MIIEVIATTVKDAINIEKSGASRIELVSGILEGGLTPSISLIKEVCNNVSIPVNIMVRPHSKSFEYDKQDFKVILNDIREIKKTKANGIVFGSLNSNGTINFDQLIEVLDVKGDLDITFHRAIDSTKNIKGEFEKLLNFNITTILTSAGNEKVYEDIPLFNELSKMSKEKNIKILAGSGLHADNIIEFLSTAATEEVHIGSGAKYNRNNLSEIDTSVLSNMILKIRDMEK